MSQVTDNTACYHKSKHKSVKYGNKLNELQLHIKATRATFHVIILGLPNHCLTLSIKPIPYHCLRYCNLLPFSFRILLNLSYPLILLNFRIKKGLHLAIPFPVCSYPVFCFMYLRLARHISSRRDRLQALRMRRNSSLCSSDNAAFARKPLSEAIKAAPKRQMASDRTFFDRPSAREPAGV